ncbi:MAG: MFS transporter [Caldilineaceae bacterium]|nr:MFS transporter [Caldilineaceae bacterium]
MEQAQPRDELSFARLIGTGIAGKLTVDIGSQIFNPFLPVIAAGLGIDVVTLGRLVGLRSAMGIFAPVSGWLADQRGYRVVIRGALLLNAIGFVLVAVGSWPWSIVAGMVLAGLGMSAFVPNLQAYVSGRLPYTLRARGLGMVEYAWALTGIVGLSVVGVLIEATNWRLPFVLLALGMLVMAYVFSRMPAAREHGAPPRTPAGRVSLSSLRAFFALGSNARSTYATISAGALSYFAAMQVMLAHGAWLADQYGLTPASLGMVAFAFGWFDLAASVSVSLFTDRIGKRRSVLLGIAGSLAGYLLMPFLNISVIWAVAIIGTARMFFEFNIVSHFPLLSEQAPAQRGKTMTLGASAALTGGTVAGFTGPWLLVTHGVQALAWSSAATVTVALLIVLLLVRERAE